MWWDVSMQKNDNFYAQSRRWGERRPRFVLKTNIECLTLSSRVSRTPDWCSAVAGVDLVESLLFYDEKYLPWNTRQTNTSGHKDKRGELRERSDLLLLHKVWSKSDKSSWWLFISKNQRKVNIMRNMWESSAILSISTATETDINKLPTLKISIFSLCGGFVTRLGLIML